MAGDMMIYETKPNVRINHIMPHYTDSRFQHPQTVYLADGYTLRRGSFPNVKGAVYNYSDRLIQWYDSEDVDAAIEAAEAAHEFQSGAYFETYLRTLLQDGQLKLVHILSGFNWSSGHPYCVFGYITSEGAA